MNLKSLSKETKVAIEETLRVVEMLSPENAKRIQDDIESFSSEDEIIEYLINPLQLYMEMYNEIDKNVINKVVKSERIIITEKFTVPHLGLDGIVTNKQHVALPLYVRANQQKIFKEGRSAKDTLQRNVANQVTGDSKKGTFSDTEIVTTIVHGGEDILRELLGPASHNLVSNSEMKSDIIRTGKAELKNLSNNSADKGASLYMDQILKGMGFDSDIIRTPE